MQKRIGKITRKIAGSVDGYGGRDRLFLEYDPTEYMAAAHVNGAVPESGLVELCGDFPDDFIHPGRLMPYFVFSEVRVPS